MDSTTNCLGNPSTCGQVYIVIVASSSGSPGEGKEPGMHARNRGGRDRILLEYVCIFMTSRQSATLVVAIWSGFSFVLLVITKRQKG